MLKALIEWFLRLFSAGGGATTATATAAPATPTNEPPAADDPIVNDQPDDDIDVDDLEDTDPVDLEEGEEFPEPPADWGTDEEDDWDDPEVIITAGDDDPELAGDR